MRRACRACRVLTVHSLASCASKFSRRRFSSNPCARRRGARPLLIASCVLIGSVAAVVYNFLDGAVTVPFVLKVLAVGAIAGTAFA